MEEECSLHGLQSVQSVGKMSTLGPIRPDSGELSTSFCSRRVRVKETQLLLEEQQMRMMTGDTSLPDSFMRNSESFHIAAQFPPTNLSLRSEAISAPEHSRTALGGEKLEAKPEHSGRKSSDSPSFIQHRREL